MQFVLSAEKVTQCNACECLCHANVDYFVYTSSSRASRGQKFQKDKSKNLLIECVQGDEPVRSPNRVFVRTSVQVSVVVM